MVLQWFPERLGANRDYYQVIIPATRVTLTLSVAIVVFNQLLCMLHWLSAVFIQGKRGSCDKIGACICFSLLHIQRSSSFSSQKEGKLFLFFTATKMGGICELVCMLYFGTSGFSTEFLLGLVSMFSDKRSWNNISKHHAYTTLTLEESGSLCSCRKITYYS